MKGDIIIIILVVGVILLVLWLNSCEKYSSHIFPGPQSDGYDHSIHVGTGNFDWSKVSGYEGCMKMLINQSVPHREADTMCTPYLSDPEVEEFPF